MNTIRKYLNVRQQILLLLFLFFIGGWQEMRADGEGTWLNPYSGNIGIVTLKGVEDVYIHGLTNGRFNLADGAYVRLHVIGYNEVSHSSGIVFNVGYGGAELYIEGYIGGGADGKPVLKVHGSPGIGCEFTSTSQVPGKIGIAGPIFVEADGSPGIGGKGKVSIHKVQVKCSYIANISMGSGANAAQFLGNTDGEHYYQLANITPTTTNISGNGDYLHIIDYSKTVGANFSDWVALESSNTDYSQIYTKMRGQNSKLYLYSESSNRKTYVVIGGIPAPLSYSSSSTTTYLGAVYSGSTYYRSIDGSFSSTVYMNIDKYPYSGTFKAGGNVIFDGKASSGYVMNTSAGGVIFDASSSNTITLKNLTCPSSGNNKLKIKGKVLLNKNTCNLGAGVTVDSSTGKPVYYCIIKNIKGTGLTVKNNGTAHNNYYWDGTNLYAWLPKGVNMLSVTTNSQSYSMMANVEEKHYQELDINSGDIIFDIKQSSLQLTTASSGNQTVRYDNQNYAIPYDKTITIKGTSTNGNTITVKGSATANIILESVAIGGTPNNPLSITESASANITVKGTCSLISSSSAGILVDTDCSMKLTTPEDGSAASLAVTGESSTQQDILNKGTIRIAGPLTLQAVNGHFKPTAIPSETQHGTPVIKLRTDTYFRTSLPATSEGVGTVISGLKYKETNDVLSKDLYTEDPVTTVDGDFFFFWMPTHTSEIVFTGNVPNEGTLYSLPEQDIERHNQALVYKRVVASITVNGLQNIYDSMPAAFAAATNGQIVKMETNYQIPDNTNVALKLLQPGESVTLDLDKYTLTAGVNTFLSAGRGILKLTAGEGTLQGKFNIEGCFFTEVGSSKLGTVSMKDQIVYRTWVNNLPQGISDRLLFRLDEGTDEREISLNSGSACLWLPSGQQTAVISDILAGANEPVALATCAVKSNHDENTVDALLLADIQYGDITVTPGSPTTVSYGSKPYTANLTKNSATNRFYIQGKANAENGRDHKITIAAGTGGATAYVCLREVDIKPQTSQPAIAVNGLVDLQLFNDNKLQGGASNLSSSSSPAIQIAANTTMTLCNYETKDGNEGKGRLYVNGGAIGSKTSPAIEVKDNGSLVIAGATVVARHGDTTPVNAISGGMQKIESGSVDALYTAANRPTNKGGNQVYKVTVTTGLNPEQPYTCSYEGCSSSFWALPDEAGKVYCWQPAQPLSADKTQVLLTHPVSYEKTEIEVVEVKEDDDNVAPIVIRMIGPDGKVTSFGNLKDAFDAMESGTNGHPTVYKLLLLTRIANLRTAQVVPAYTEATLDLGSFELAAQNGSDVSFDASANGAYMNITGKGNIKNTFRIMGDVFITGIVPLTDAVVELDGKAVFRTLVKDLPVGDGNSYTYSYGQLQNVSFNIHEAQACLWLPDYGRSEELRFTVSGTGGSNTEYTAGNITTVTQRTEAIPATPVGVVARVVYKNDKGTEQNQSFNTLQEAFNAANKAYGEKATNICVRLLTGCSIVGTLKAQGMFTLDLDGKNISSASGGKLQVADGANIIIADGTAGVKGALDTHVELGNNGLLFIPGAVQMKGNVMKTGTDTYLWRTMINMSYLDAGIAKVGFKGTDYPVVGNEACLWLPENTNTAETYTFTVEGKAYEVTDRIISPDHNNDMTIGGTNNKARIGNTEYATLEEALNSSVSGSTVELLQTQPLSTDFTLTGKHIILELGKYSLTAEAEDVKKIIIGSDASLVVTSRVGNGQLKAPVLLKGGTFYAGQDITGDHIGEVKQDGSETDLYRLLVTNLPATIPSDTYRFIYEEVDAEGQSKGAKQEGAFMVRQGYACLWLEEAMARRLKFTVAGSPYTTDNVTVNSDHYNIETYGVSDVAQIRNGKKYRELATAFADAAGKTIVLLKNAALKQDVTVSGSVVLETGSYTVTSQDVASMKAVITVPEMSNLQITGKGTVGSNFVIAKAGRTDIRSNGNLQADRLVTLTGTVTLGDKSLQRVSVEGLPAAVNADYEYNGQKGQATTSSEGSLCLWMNVNSSPANFFVEAAGATYMATAVLVTGTHINPVTVTKVAAVAEIGDQTYNTLADAFDDLTTGATVNLRKSQTDLTGDHTLPAGLTGTVTLDLGGNGMTAASATFTAGNGQQLVVENGSLGGLVAFSGDIYAAGSVVMNNAQVSLDGKTVWRTFLTLPDGTTTFSYRLGDGTAVSSGNIRPVDGHPVACLWLPSSNVARTLTVTAGDVEYALDNVVVASTHGNELDVTAGNDPVAEVDTKTFASLASALASVAEGGTVTLKKNLSLSSVQDIKKNLTLNLGGLSFTSGNSGFNVDAGKTLKIVGGMLLGTLRLQGEGTVSAGSDVKIAGIVLNKENKEVYRTLIKRGPSDAGLPGCYWLEATGADYDLTLPAVTVPGETWETTVPGTLGNHNTTLTAYKRIEIASGTQSWNDSYQQTNLVLASGAVLDVKGVTGTFSLHRLTLHDGSKVATANSGLVVAEEGIRYIRTFTGTDRWESVALPFTADRIMTEEADADAPGGKRITPLLPATGTGTAGNFWLKTMNAGGTLQNVSTTEMTANVSYLMAVPSQLQDKAITFVSGPNQLLRRDKVTAVKLASGFASYANGTLDELTVNEYCYVLNDAGDAYERKTTAVILPFRGYLLADANTTTIKPQLRIGVITDAVVPVVQEQLRIHTLPGRVVIESLREEQIRIHTFDGRLLRALRIPAGYTEIALPRGLYIINHQKIIINK